MGNLMTGILGAVQGGGNAVAEIDKDKRHALAEKLKAEQMHKLNLELEDKKQAGRVEVQGMRDKSQLENTGLLTASREKEGEADRTLREDLANIEKELKERQLKVGEDTLEAKTLSNKLKAIDLYNRAIRDGDKPGDVKWILETAGIFSQASSSNDVDELLRGAKSSMAQQSEVNEGLPAPKATEGTEIPYNPEVPETWNVVTQRGELSVITPDGPVKMTPEQIEAWKKTPNGKSFFSNPTVDGLLGGMKNWGDGADRRKKRDAGSFVREPPK